MPKRSSGCDLCRKRKVRCDEGRPRCQRCTNFGATCPGYTRTESVVFRDQTKHTASKAKTKHLIKPQSQETFWSPPPASSTSEFSERSLSQSPVAIYPASVNPNSIDSRAATRAMLLARFFDTYLPRSEKNSGNNESQYTYLLEIPRSNTSNLAFVAAVDALTIVQLGTEHGDANLLHESRFMYGKALAYMCRALLHPKLQAQDETLAAVAILGLCDFFQGTSQNGNGWLSHATGANGILRYRGPESIKSALAMKLYLNQRSTSTLSGLLTRKAVFFDHPNWLRLTIDSSASNNWIAISDIMVRIPALLEDTDRVFFSPFQDPWSWEIPDEAFSIMARYTILQKRLQHWYINFVSGIEGSMCESVDVTTMIDFWKLSPDQTFPTVLHFPSFSIAYHYALYSLASHIICKNAAEVRSALPAQTSSLFMGTDQPLPSLMFLRHLAHVHIFSLARSIPYLCTSPAASVGRIQSLAFLWFAQDYFGSHKATSQLSPSGAPNPCPPQDYSQQRLWCLKIYRALAAKGIVPPRVSLPANSNRAGGIGDRPIVKEDVVSEQVDRVVEMLGDGIND